MKFAIRVDHYSDAPTEASRCPTCGRAMPVFDAMHAVLGPEGTGVVIRAIDFALTCPCGADSPSGSPQGSGCRPSSKVRTTRAGTHEVTIERSHDRRVRGVRPAHARGSEGRVLRGHGAVAGRALQRVGRTATEGELRCALRRSLFIGASTPR